MSASRNFCRSSLRATAVSTSGSASKRPPSSFEKRSATCPLVLWMAGAMMCEGFSWASWMMYSPRSVSTGLTPAASRASLSSISSVAIDLLFTAMRTPLSRQRRRTMSRASSPVAAQWTWPPSRSMLSASRSRWRSSCWSVPSLMARALSRSASPSGKPAKDSLRRPMNLVVAMPSASCRWASSSAACARAGNGVRRLRVAHARLRRRQDLGEMHRAHARSPSREPAAHLHEAARVAGHETVDARALHVGELLVEDGGGHLGQPHREGAAESAALVRARQLDQLAALDALEQRPRAPRLAEARAADGRSRGRSPCP